MPTYVDLDREYPERVIDVPATFVLDVGCPGTFDADGVMPSAVLHHGSDVLMYYSGWSRLGGRVPYNNATGLAVSHDGGHTFERVFKGPILDRAPHEPWSATSPGILRTESGWHMWYSSGTGWIEIGGKPEHTYVLMHATSVDGREWQRDHRPAIDALKPDESQTRPTVAFLDGVWHMWFCYRGSAGFREDGDTYRIGHARSSDLESWERDDASSSVERAADGWDAQMQCYPNVLGVGDRLLMFYNGNHFGAAGFGYAELDPTD